MGWGHFRIFKQSEKKNSCSINYFSLCSRPLARAAPRRAAENQAAPSPAWEDAARATPQPRPPGSAVMPPARRPPPAAAGHAAFARTEHLSAALNPLQASQLSRLADSHLRGRAPPGGRGGWRSPRALTGKLEVRRRAAGVSAAVAHFARRPGLHHSPKIGRQVWEAGSGAHHLGRPRVPRCGAARAPRPLPRGPHTGPHPQGAWRPIWARLPRADFSASPSVYMGRHCGSVL